MVGTRTIWRVASGAAGAILMCGVSTAAMAQAASSPGTDPGVGEVVVTANKRPEKIQDVALAVTAINADELERSQSVGFQDFAASVPGFSIETQSSGFNRLILRGENTGSSGASVASTVDDMPFNFSTSKGDGALITANIDTWDLKQIEVLRGPQGTLYGAAAEGGLIKYVTNAPNLHAYSAAAEISGQSVDGGQTAASEKVMVNVPIIEDKLAFRISGYNETLPGYVNNPLLNEKDTNRGDKYGFTASILAKPIENLTARFTAYSQGLKTDGNGAVDVIGDALKPATQPSNQFTLVNGLNSNEYNDAINKSRLTYFSLDLSYDLKWATLTSITSYGIISDFFTGDISDQNAAPGLTYAKYFGTYVYKQPISIDGDQSESLHKTSEELRLASNPGKQFDWQVGFFYTRETTTFNQFYNIYNTTSGALVTNPAVGADTDPVKFTEYAGFLDGAYHFTKQFDIEVGARYTSSTQNALSTTYCCILFSNTVTAGASKDDDFTYSIGPRYHINDDIMLYGRVATGYRPGGPLFKPGQGLTEYHSDSTINYETGIKSSLLDHLITIDADVFYIDWSHIQITTSLLGSNGVYYTSTGNAGKAKSTGAEWNFGMTPMKGLTFAFVGAYIDAELTQSAPKLGGVSGNQLPYVPKFSSNLTANYDWTIYPSYKGFVGGAWNLVGSRYSDFATGSTLEDHAKLPSYDKVDLYAGVRKDGYTAEVYIKNVGNERGITYYQNQGGYAQTGLANIIQPTTVGIVLSARY